MRANAGICLLSQSRKIASSNYHQQRKDAMLSFHRPRSEYPGFEKGTELPPAQFSSVKISQVVPCEKISVEFIRVNLG